MAFKLSKTNYMKGCQCPKALWLQTKERHLATPPDANTQKMFDEGHQVGNLARELYPGGKEIPFDTKPYARKFSLTAQYVQEGVTSIYEASVESQHMMCMVDILHHGESGWELIEVKSSSSLKDDHLDDVAVQYHILKEAGLEVVKAKLVHINPDYVRQTYFELKDYFVEHDITQEVLDRQAAIQAKLPELLSVMNSYQKPDIELGPHCLRPYECNFKAHCWENFPEQSCFTLAGMPYEERFDLFHKGLIRFEDLLNAPLPDYAKQQVELELNQGFSVDTAALDGFLNTLFYPMVFFDFETIHPIIPQFHHTYARQQVPFQFSAHLMNSPFDVPSHFEFIGDSVEDPRWDLIQYFLNVVPDNACILVYNQDFEKQVIEELAMAFPDCKDELMKRHANIRDLMIPFKERMVYSHTMKGRYSIKTILPILCPGLSYDDLEVQEGLTASKRYVEIGAMEDDAEKDRARHALLAYCKLDTYAMIELLNVLRTKQWAFESTPHELKHF